MSPSFAVEFLIWLLIAASVIAIAAKRLHVPYTVSLVLAGLLIGAVRLPVLSPLQSGHRPQWLTPEVILIVFLPALIFEASIKISARDLLRDFVPLLLLANLGVVIATVVTGYLVHWGIGLPLLLSLVFGSLISATDPISVLALFRELRTSRRLCLIVEGESLLNDGTAVVLFEILISVVVAGRIGITGGVGRFLFAVSAGATLGYVLGLIAIKITGYVNDPHVEITLTTILAYGTYLLAYHLHVSGVIATLAAGLTVGNLGGERVMSVQSRAAMQAFWEYASFVINSLVFLLIGLEVHIGQLAHAWWPALVAIGAVLAGRAFSVYALVPISNLFTKRIPVSWQHVTVWGGLRGALALALALSLDGSFPHRGEILGITFGVVIFSILVQGLTMKPLLRMLHVAEIDPEPQPYIIKM